MAKRIPFFSIVIPTRNRPELIQYCLESLLLQTFSDFEVIVSDNHTGKPCKAVFDRFADERFKYVNPPSPLTMHDNWEFACSFSKGEYMTVLIDKTILRPSALQITNETLNRMPSELVSWWNEGYIPTREDHGYDEGQYLPSYSVRSPHYFNHQKELERRFRVDMRRGTEGVRYYWGKVCFGAYHQNLVKRIKEGVGRLFHPISPDYTSMLVALAYTQSALDMGQPLSISILTNVSNGKMVAEHDAYAMDFMKNIDPSLQILNALPLKGLYASSHNIVAVDYLVMKEKIGEPMGDLTLDMKNLILRAREDLDHRVTWDSEFWKKEQYALWQKYFGELTLRNRISIYLQLTKPGFLQRGRGLQGFITRALTRLPGIRRARDSYFGWRLARLTKTNRQPSGDDSALYYRWRLTRDLEAKVFDNVVEAAKYADHYYKRLLSPLFHSAEAEE